MDSKLIHLKKKNLWLIFLEIKKEKNSLPTAAFWDATGSTVTSKGFQPIAKKKKTLVNFF